nr:hypothetical protein BaRGS_014012 [Batillaria attramentaria]
MSFVVSSFVGTDEALLEWLWEVGSGIIFHDRTDERDKDSVEDSKLLLWVPPWAEIGENSALEGAGAEEEICDTGTVLPTGLKAELGEPRLRGPDPLLGVCGWYRWSQTSDSSVELANLLSPSKSLEYRKMEDCWTPNLRMTHGGWESLSE